MRNRLYNCKNPYQGEAKRVLCVCSAGLLRSPTTAVVLQQEYGYNTRAAGMDASHALIPVDQVLVTWADEIVCMNDQQAKTLSKMCEDLIDKPVIKTLNIPDSFGYMDEKLQGYIKDAYLNCNNGGG